MNINNMREVKFAKYCPLCKHWKSDEFKDPCNECLESGMNEETDRPVCWEEKG